MITRYGHTPGFCDEPGEFEETADGDYVLYEACAKLVAALKAFVEEWDEFAMNQLADCYQQAREALREIGE